MEKNPKPLNGSIKNKPMKPFIESTRVKLRIPVPSDIALLRELDSDPEVMKHLTGGRPSTEEELKATIERIVELSEKFQDKFGVWLAFDKSTDEFIGWFLFRPDKKNPDDHLNPELGYRLKKKFWGKGIASEVSKVIVDRAFTNYNFESIFAITLKANLGSQGVMKKIGMKWSKDYLEDQFPGEDKDAVRFAITRDEWLSGAGR